MGKILQKPLACRNAHCGAMCFPLQAEEMDRIWDGKPSKCPFYERRDDLYRNDELLNKVKQVREDIENELKVWNEPSKYNVKPLDAIKNAKAQSYKHCLEILDELIESEE